MILGLARRAADDDPNEMENIKVKQEIDNDTVKTGDVPGEYSFVKFYEVLEV
jgi:hypothetical protein